MTQNDLALDLETFQGDLRLDLKNFMKLGVGWDVSAVHQQICQYDHLFQGVPKDVAPGDLGYTHRDAELILLRYAEIPKDVLTNPAQVAAVADDLFPKPYPAWDLFTSVHPLVYELMRRIHGTHLGGIAIVKLPPAGVIESHVDTGRAVEYFRRHHIVINGPKNCWFTCGNEQVEQLTGDVWWFSAQLLHSVKNQSHETRISISIDIAV